MINSSSPQNAISESKEVLRKNSSRNRASSNKKLPHQKLIESFPQSTSNRSKRVTLKADLITKNKHPSETFDFPQSDTSNFTNESSNPIQNHFSITSLSPTSVSISSLPGVSKGNTQTAPNNIDSYLNNLSNTDHSFDPTNSVNTSETNSALQQNSKKFDTLEHEETLSHTSASIHDTQSVRINAAQSSNLHERSNISVNEPLEAFTDSDNILNTKGWYISNPEIFSVPKYKQCKDKEYAQGFSDVFYKTPYKYQLSVTMKKINPLNENDKIKSIPDENIHRFIQNAADESNRANKLNKDENISKFVLQDKNSKSGPNDDRKYQKAGHSEDNRKFTKTNYSDDSRKYSKSIPMDERKYSKMGPMEENRNNRTHEEHNDNYYVNYSIGISASIPVADTMVGGSKQSDDTQDEESSAEEAPGSGLRIKHSQQKHQPEMLTTLYNSVSIDKSKEDINRFNNEISSQQKESFLHNQSQQSQYNIPSINQYSDISISNIYPYSISQSNTSFPDNSNEIDKHTSILSKQSSYSSHISDISTKTSSSTLSTSLSNISPSDSNISPNENIKSNRLLLTNNDHKEIQKIGFVTKNGEITSGDEFIKEPVHVLIIQLLFDNLEVVRFEEPKTIIKKGKQIKEKEILGGSVSIFRELVMQDLKEAVFGHLSFHDVCSYKLGGRNFRLCLYVVELPNEISIEEFEKQIEEHDPKRFIQLQGSKIVGKLISPSFTIRAKKPTHRKKGQKRKHSEENESIHPVEESGSPLKRMKIDDTISFVLQQYSMMPEEQQQNLLTSLMANSSDRIKEIVHRDCFPHPTISSIANAQPISLAHQNLPISSITLQSVPQLHSVNPLRGFANIQSFNNISSLKDTQTLANLASLHNMQALQEGHSIHPFHQANFQSYQKFNPLRQLHEEQHIGHHVPTIQSANINDSQSLQNLHRIVQPESTIQDSNLLNVENDIERGLERNVVRENKEEGTDGFQTSHDEDLVNISDQIDSNNDRFEWIPFSFDSLL